MTGEPLRKTPDQKGPVLQMVEFEDVQIQWNRGQWNFNNPEQGSVLIDTYSVWNREHWGEIADRLLSGQTCALYMMGNFGVARVYDLQDTKSEDVILDDIKRRERINNLVGFAPPEDIGGLIDFERLPERFADLQDAEKRRALYPGPMHAVFPLKDPDSANSSIVRQDDKTIAIFWIPGHWGYEGLSQQMKIRGAKGILGGGSLNLHGAEPSYTAQALHEQMERIPEWQTNIDFILFDELAEAAGIGRSHTQVSFVVDPQK